MALHFPHYCINNSQKARQSKNEQSVYKHPEVAAEDVVHVDMAPAVMGKVMVSCISKGSLPWSVMVKSLN